MIDRSVSHYKFIERLGAGGMGEIYKAQDVRLNRTVAVKMVTATTNDDIEKRRRFLQEARAASGLNHPNIITVHDLVSDKDSEFLVMEFVSGRTLAELIRPGGMNPAKVLEYALQITDALASAHGAGIVHRDIKPGNIMVTENELIKVLDFGLAKLTFSEPIDEGNNEVTRTMFTAMTVEGSILGTVSYMSPEQAEGRPVDARSDIFSFGVVLYEMLTGQKAFKGQSALSTLSAILRDDVRPIPELAPAVPPNLVDLTLRCLAKKPEERWQSMRDIHKELRNIKDMSDTARLTAPLLAAPKTVPKRNPKWMNAVAIVVPGLILLGLFWMLSNRASQPDTKATVEQPPAAPNAPPDAAVAEVKPTEDALTNANVIDMVKAKVPRSVIVSHVRTALVTNFDVSTNELIRLGQEGVPEEVIQAMSGRWRLTPQRTAAAPAPAPTNKSGEVATVSPTPQTPLVSTQQQPVPQQLTPQQTAAAAKLTPVAVRNGTPLEIILAQSIPEGAAAGAPLVFNAKQDFRVDGSVIIPAGATVRGEIVEAKKGGFLGGKLTFRLIDATAVGGAVLKVRAIPSPKGDNRRSIDTNGAKPSKGMAADAGALYIGYTDGDQTISVAK